MTGPDDPNTPETPAQVGGKIDLDSVLLAKQHDKSAWLIVHAWVCEGDEP